MSHKIVMDFDGRSIPTTNVTSVVVELHEQNTEAIAFNNDPISFLNSELRSICGCESSFEGTASGLPRQYEQDGSLRVGAVNKHDIGACMINELYHRTSAEKLGFDIDTLDGNIGYAMYLYEHQGSAPWNWSRPCWGD